MNVQDKIKELMQVLAERGLNDEAIMNVRDGLWSQANDAFTQNVLAHLTDDDLKQLEEAETREAANDMLKKFYSEKTGKDMEEEMNEIIIGYADDLINKYKVGEATPMSSEVSPSLEEQQTTI